MGSRHTPTLSAKRTIREIGEGLRIARLRRSLTMEIVADRAMITLPTLSKVEKGDPGVSIGIYASVMTALGLDWLKGISDNDPVGQDLAEDALPKRVRMKKSKNV